MPQRDKVRAGFADVDVEGACARPSTFRRVMGIVGLVVTAAVTAAILYGLSRPELEASIRAAVVAFVVGGLLWLPWVAAKTVFPQHKFRWHVGLTAEAFIDLSTAWAGVLIAVPITGALAIVFGLTGSHAQFSISFVLYVMCALAWGFYTAIAMRRIADDDTRGENAGPPNGASPA